MLNTFKWPFKCIKEYRNAYGQLINKEFWFFSVFKDILCPPLPWHEFHQGYEFVYLIKERRFLVCGGGDGGIDDGGSSIVRDGS